MKWFIVDQHQEQNSFNSGTALGKTFPMHIMCIFPTLDLYAKGRFLKIPTGVKLPFTWTVWMLDVYSFHKADCSHTWTSDSLITNPWQNWHQSTIKRPPLLRLFPLSLHCAAVGWAWKPQEWSSISSQGVKNVLAGEGQLGNSTGLGLWHRDNETRRVKWETNVMHLLLAIITIILKCKKALFTFLVHLLTKYRSALRTDSN